MTPFEYEDSSLDYLSTRAIPKITMRGSLVVFTSGYAGKPPPIKVKGSVIKEFSRASRLRLLRFTSTIQFRTIGKSIFITLTYPDEAMVWDYYYRQQHLRLFLRKIETYLGKKVCGIWRCEWEERKSGKCVGMFAPHFHLLLFNVRWVPASSAREWWAGVIHHAGYVRTEVKRAKGAKGCGYYVSKYVAKVPVGRSLVIDLNPDSTGKHYGYIRRGLIPRHTQTEINDPSPEHIRRLWEYATSAMPWARIRLGDSFTLLGRSAIAASVAMREMGLDHLTAGE